MCLCIRRMHGIIIYAMYAISAKKNIASGPPVERVCTYIIEYNNISKHV